MHITDFVGMDYKKKGENQSDTNGQCTEFTSSVFTNWCYKQRIEIRYIQPTKRVQNAFIERFNRSYRTEVLDARIFNSLIEVREITSDWMEHYNNRRQHEA